MKLTFKDTKIVHLSRYPGEDGVTQVLKVRALLTRTLAEQLKCHDLCFAANNMPRRFDSLKLTERIDGCEVVLDGATWLANSAHGFRVGRPKDASETDGSLEVTCSLHFDRQVRVADWMDEQNKAQFQMTVKPPKDWRAQGELAFEDKPPAGDDDEQEPIEENLQGEALAAHQARTGAVAPAAAMGGTPGRKKSASRSRTPHKQADRPDDFRAHDREAGRTIVWRPLQK